MLRKKTGEEKNRLRKSKVAKTSAQKKIYSNLAVTSNYINFKPYKFPVIILCFKPVMNPGGSRGKGGEVIGKTGPFLMFFDKKCNMTFPWNFPQYHGYQ